MAPSQKSWHLLILFIMPKRIHIGGVPEHFNLPWTQAVEKDAFGEHRIDVAWTYFSGGTGAMTKALASGDLDMAILLTEGYVSAIAQGLKAKIVKVYIETPLVWGIHTAQPNVHSVTDIQAPNYAISRLGSGSHLMAMIHAHQLGRTVLLEQLIAVQSLDGAIESLKKKETDLFYWEKFMTRPFVKKGWVQKIGEFSAPWSSFLIVASEDALNHSSDAIHSVLKIMNERCIDFQKNKTAAEQVSQVFHMTLEEARQWLDSTKWNNGFDVQEAQLLHAYQALESIGAVQSKLHFPSFCAPWVSCI
jgi:sulfonate transport system substrate-binding protein